MILQSAGDVLGEPLGSLHISPRKTFSQGFSCGEMGNDAA